MKTLPTFMLIRIPHVLTKYLYSTFVLLKPNGCCWDKSNILLSWVRNIYNFCCCTYLFHLLVSEVVPLVQALLFPPVISNYVEGINNHTFHPGSWLDDRALFNESTTSVLALQESKGSTHRGNH